MRTEAKSQEREEKGDKSQLKKMEQKNGKYMRTENQIKREDKRRGEKRRESSEKGRRKQKLGFTADGDVWNAPRHNSGTSEPACRGSGGDE